jgi:RNA methyltransferase, RsmE family
MHRFFVDRDAIHEDNLTICGEDVKHIYKVLRLRAGDPISVSDGDGFDFLCKIDTIDKDSVLCSIIDKHWNASEPPVKVDLYQGIPKSAKMDIIVQKCVELGVNSVTPVDTERVVVDTDNLKGISNRTARWQRISEEAAKQSCRGAIPIISDPVTFSNVLDRISNYDLMLMPYENERNTGLKQVLRGKNNINSIAVLIGPEGGFSEAEVEIALSKGIVPVTLGPRILRTETAGFACLSLIMYELGDMGGGLWQE